jgi:MFS family permease
LISEIAGPFVQQILHRPVEDMSIVLAPAAIGLIGASILMPRITERVEKMNLTITGLVVFAAGFLLLPACQWLALYFDPRHGATSPWLLWTTVLLVFLLGVAMACVNIPTQLMMQERAPESGRGRVLALQFMLYNVGSIPILLFAGVIAQLIGLNPLILLISASILLFCWWGAHYVKGDKQSIEKAV